MRYKNALLFSCFLIGQIPAIFYGSVERLNLSLFVERSTRVDFFMMYYANAVSFLILSHLIVYPKGVDKRIARFILIICYLDLLHLLLFASQGFGMVKIGIGIGAYYLYRLIKKRNDKI
tara:strand:+ start:589 stop:945 length:357 start_codon:yes stop_codon:yes gene_type:complete